MKRSYLDMSSSLLPKLADSDPKHFKSVLEGTYSLTVINCVDISKPTQRPIEEIDEPEEDEALQQNKLNKSNARMLQLHLRDSDKTEIMALETERIERLTEVRPNFIITISGPVEVRCKSMMLMDKHLTNVQLPPKDEANSDQLKPLPLKAPATREQQCQNQQSKPHLGEPSVVSVAQPKNENVPVSMNIKPELIVEQPEIIMVEDWDEAESDGSDIIWES